MQKCFKCDGDGKIYPFEGKKGIGELCDACQGEKEIKPHLVKCPKCNGDGKEYPFEGKNEIPNNCPLCKKKGYIDGIYDICKLCEGDGKIYPFAGKKGIGDTCNKCSGDGFFISKRPEQQWPQQSQNINSEMTGMGMNSHTFMQPGIDINFEIQPGMNQPPQNAQISMNMGMGMPGISTSVSEPNKVNEVNKNMEGGFGF